MPRPNLAVIFDMDGVLVDNLPFHRQAWSLICKKYSLNITDPDFIRKLFGRSNREILLALFGKELSPEEILRLTAEKEALYREIYQDHIQPVAGLIPLLDDLKRERVRLGVATLGPTENLNFVMDRLNIRHYYDALLDAASVRQGKPDPEIYLKTAERLGVEPHRCLAFEDSLPGVEAGLRAGMTVIGVATTLSEREFPHTARVVRDYSALKYGSLRLLLENRNA